MFHGVFDNLFVLFHFKMFQRHVHPRFNFHMKRRDSGSTPVVGSSKKTQRGSPTKDKPKESFRRVPPEKEKACLSLGANRWIYEGWMDCCSLAKNHLSNHRCLFRDLGNFVTPT